METEILNGHKEVYAVIQGFTDNCTYSAEDFNSLELFFNKEDAELRVIELELEFLESGDSDYKYVYMEMVKIK
jgi:hypothetical protein